MSQQGTPILGDKIYCKHTPIGVGKGMFLFANKLRFEAFALVLTQKVVVQIKSCYLVVHKIFCFTNLLYYNLK